MPDAPGLELIRAEINRDHPGAILDTSFDREQPALIADPAQILDVLGWLRETPDQEYTFMSSVHGVDHFPLAPRFAVHYELMNRERHERLCVKAVLPDPAAGGADSVAAPDGRDGGVPEAAVATPNTMEYNGELLPSLKSCVHLYPTADFQEREVFDFFGIFFEGHPDLRRILMPEDYVGWPQRRDFPVGGEPVLFTKDEVENPGWWK